MVITSQINQMTKEKKLRTMELIWDALCRTSDFSSPEWHKHILEEREKRIKEGEEEILDWEESKRQVKESFSWKFGLTGDNQEGRVYSNHRSCTGRWLLGDFPGGSG